MCCLHPPSRARQVADVCTVLPLVILLVLRWEPAKTVSSCGIHLQTNHDLAIGDLAIGDLAIECFGVHGIESLDVRVRVATNFVKMMMRKKTARNESSNVDSTITIGKFSSSGLCLVISFFGISEFCLPCCQLWVCNKFFLFMGPH